VSFDPEAEREVDFGRMWRLLAARWWVPAGGLVLGAIVGYAVALGGSQTYSASATLYLGQPYTASGNVALQALQTNPSTVGTVAHSLAIDQRVAELCKAKIGTFRSGISTKPIAGSLAKNGQNPLVSLTVKSPKKKTAACAANQLAKSVVARISAYATEKIASFRSQLSKQEQEISALGAAISDPNVSTTDKLILQVQLNSAQSDLSLTSQLLHQATAVEEPSVLTPASAARVTARSRRNSVVVAGLIGLVLGALAALLWDRVAAAVARRNARG
jgi:capsular polysaccharide biosynthesis protein